MPPKREDIQLDKIKDLIGKGHTIVSVATYFNCTCRTIVRHLAAASLTKEDLKMPVTHLDILVDGVSNDIPSWGRRLMTGHLAAHGLRVPEKKLRESLLRTRPDLVENRKRRKLKRRVYQVPHAMALVHLDGNDKMINWKFQIHGLVDGYSRYVLFLSCGDNKRSVNVYTLFKQTVSIYGLPDRVRTDAGLENVRVCDAMLYFRGCEPRPHIVGKSVHNQRIEKFWVYVNEALHVLKNRLLALELQNCLDRENPVHIICLHSAFKEVINERLEQLQKAWNFHHISGEHGATPNSMLTKSIKENPNRSVYPLMDDFEVFERSIPDTTVQDSPVVEEQLEALLSNLPAEKRLLFQDIAAELRTKSITEEVAYMGFCSVTT